MPTCPTCGQENPQGFRFCGMCGIRLVTTFRPLAEERKVVSVLFVDLVGFTSRAEYADPEEVYATLSRYHGRVKQEIERFAGRIEKFIGDAIVGVFGVPAHEDDAERAVRAALRVVEAINELNAEVPGLELAVRAAVNSGEAVVALTAQQDLGEHFVTGDVANTASRLQSIAPVGGVVVGELTHQLTRHTVVYRELPATRVKGKVRPVRIWQALSVRSRYGIDVERDPRTPFVGRDRELDLLKQIYARTIQEATGGFVTITGEPGVGKSRLVREFFTFVDAQRELVAWRQGRCLPYGEGITFWALRELIRAEAGILESDQPAQAADKLVKAIKAVVEDPGEHEWFRARLAPLVGLAGDGTTVERTEAFTAWRRFLEAVATRRPLVLVVEDLHWADQALAEFLEFLLDRSTAVPLLILCTTRPEFFQRAPGWGTNQRNMTTVHLNPLSDEETADLIAALLPWSAPLAGFHDVLLERAGGNPLYAREFVRMLVDRELPDLGWHTAPLTGATELPVTETIQALIAARLDTLPPERKVLLQDAAVIGQVFWSGALAAMRRIEEQVVREALHELAQREFIRQVPQSSLEDQAEYAFSHGLVRDMAYSQVPRATRAQRHQSAAEWIEGLSEASAGDHAEVVAYHYGEALELARAVGATTEFLGLAERTRRSLVRAGDRALALDPAQAETNYRKALGLGSSDPSERAAILTKAAEAARQAGRLSEAQRTYEEAVAAFRSEGDLLRVGQTLVSLSLVSRHMAKPVHSENLLIEAIRLLRSERPSPELAAAYAQKAVDKVLAGRPEEALSWAEKAYGLANNLGVREEVTRALGYRGWIRSYLGDLNGLDDLRKALRDGLKLGLGYQTAALYDNLADVLWRVEGPTTALETYRAGIEVAERRGITHSMRWIQASTLGPLLDLGEWDELLCVADELIESSQLYGENYVSVFVQLYKALTLLHRGEVTQAHFVVKDLLPQVREIGDVQIAALGLAVTAQVEQARGEFRAAIELVEEFNRLTRNHSGWDRTHHLPELVRICITARELRLANELVAETKGTLKRQLYALRTAQALLVEAEGKFGHACRLHREMAGRWMQVGHVLEYGHALLGTGRCLIHLGDMDAAAPNLNQARLVLRGVGAIHLAAEAEAWLARMPPSGS